MVKTLFIMVFITILVLALSSGADMEKEKEIIKQVALDYIEGFYEGSAERMEQAIHPESHQKGSATPTACTAWPFSHVKDVFSNFCFFSKLLQGINKKGQRN